MKCFNPFADLRRSRNITTAHYSITIAIAGVMPHSMESIACMCSKCATRGSAAACLLMNDPGRHSGCQGRHYPFWNRFSRCSLLSSKKWRLREREREKYERVDFNTLTICCFSSFHFCDVRRLLTTRKCVLRNIK